MKSKTIRCWSLIHTWTSLICTLFLLLLALTGLPLIFHHEIDHLLGDAPELRPMPADTPHLDLQQLVAKAEAHRPGEVMQYFGWDEEDRNGVIAIMAKTAGTEPNLSHTFMLDARTGEAVEMPSANGGLMMVMLRLHVDMFAGLPGKLLDLGLGAVFGHRNQDHAQVQLGGHLRRLCFDLFGQKLLDLAITHADTAFNFAFAQTGEGQLCAQLCAKCAQCDAVLGQALLHFFARQLVTGCHIQLSLLDRLVFDFDARIPRLLQLGFFVDQLLDGQAIEFVGVGLCAAPRCRLTGQALTHDLNIAVGDGL